MLNIYLFLIFLIGIVMALPAFWRRCVDGRVHVSAEFTSDTVNIGTAVPVRITIANESWLPCPMIHGVLQLSKGLSSRQGNGEYLAFTLFLWMKQKIEMKQVVYGETRGPKQIVSVSLEMNEGLGLQNLTITESVNAPLFILPELLDMHDAGIVLKEINGSRDVFRWLFPDETRFKGIRPYQNRDPMKYIHWRATAKSGSLMSKQFIASIEGKTVFVLDAQFVEPFWAGASFEAFDELCSVVATWAYVLEKKGLRLSLITNGTLVRKPGKQWYGMQSAAGIHRILSRLLPYVNSPFDRLLETVRRETHANDVLIVVTRFLTARQKWLLRRLQADGRDVVLVGKGQLEGENLWNIL
jgi:uncharacterized protein (DUF58 family)